MKRTPREHPDDYVDDEGVVRRPLRRRSASLSLDDVARIAARQGPDSPAAWAARTAAELGDGCSFEVDEQDAWIVERGGNERTEGES
jgi:hypothetical protein